MTNEDGMQVLIFALLTAPLVIIAWMAAVALLSDTKRRTR